LFCSSARFWYFTGGDKMAFRKMDYKITRDPQQGGPLALLLRRYGSIGGANAHNEQLSRQKLADAERNGTPSILARIYAPTTLKIAPLPYEASVTADAKMGMLERVYQPVAPDVSSGRK
jgi:hypothetical protein